MSTWRQKAIDCLPERRKEFENRTTSIYDIFRELLPASIEAHKNNDINRLQKFYAFAEWCFRQKENDLWNSAGVAFYEHLADHEETKKAMPQWVKKDIYNDIRCLLELSVSENELAKLDKLFVNK